MEAHGLEIPELPEEEPKKALSEKALEQRRNAVKKAMERKQELSIIRKVEIEKKKLDQEEKLTKAKKDYEELEQHLKDFEEEPKKSTPETHKKEEESN